MRVLAVADLHYDEQTRGRVAALARAVCEASADVLVVAGDCAADGPELVPKVLGLLSGFSGPRLLVPGNHDLWQDQQPFETWRIYDEIIPEMAAAYGFHYLDHGAFLLGDTAFVGCMGWYDYAFRQAEAPLAEMTVTAVAVRPGEEQPMVFRALPDAREGEWEELGPEHYAARGLVWQADGAPHVAVWNDALHVEWGCSDPEVARRLAARLREQVVSVAPGARRVVGVTHVVPFAELAQYTLDNPTRAFARAYLGSPLLGEALLEAKNLELVIYGHRHRQEVREVRGVVTADAAVVAPDARPLLLTLPD